MIVTMNPFDARLSSAANAAIGSGGYNGPLTGAKLFLFSNPIVLTKRLTLADLTEAVYSGYARQGPVTWGTQIEQADGSVTILSDLHTFVAVAASGFTSGQVAGWALISNDATPVLLMAEVLGTPFQFVNPGDGFGLVVQFNLNPSNPLSQGNILA